MNPFLRLSALTLGLALSTAAGCKAHEAEGEDRVLSAAQHGRYVEALQYSQRLMEENPGDPRMQQLHRDAQVAFILDQGRDAVFHAELDAALGLFEQAALLDPENSTVRRWIGKTRAQLADHWLDVAAECTGPEQLDEAEQAYENVLEYSPGNEAARSGLARVLLLKNYRGGMSKTYFDEGLSTFRELQLDQAGRAFDISLQYRENEPAAQRKEQVRAMKAEERLVQARELEATGKYFAARNEYRLVLLIDPGHPGASDGLDRMDREVRAVRAMAEADMAIRRGALDKAEETLADAEVLTDAQKDDVTLLQAGIEERRLEDVYHQARLLAEDYRYPDAVAVYDQLLAVAPDYKDARVRKATLEEFISLTEKFYAEALVAKDDAVAERYLRAIHPVIWPEYKDVVQRLEAIEARKAAKKETEGDAGQPEGDPVPEQGGR